MKGSEALDRLRVARDGYVVMAILFYIAGIACFLPGSLSPMAACVICGIVLLGYGIIKIIGYMANDLYCLAFQYNLACGIFLTVLGIILLSCNIRIYPYLNMGAGMLILLDSLLTIQTSKDAKVFGLPTWHIILSLAILAGVFGVLLLVDPSERARQIICGCALLADGLLNQVMVHLTVKTREQIMKNRKEAES